MKTTISLLILIMISVTAQAHQLEIDAVWPESLHSAHASDCNPDCANQDNGGIGFSIRYKSDDKHLDIAVGRIYLINSFGNKGRVDFFQLDRIEYASKYIRASLSVWIMEIHGYKDGDGKPKIERLGPWPKLQAGINPIWFAVDNFYINYNLIYFPLVNIDWISASYILRF